MNGNKEKTTILPFFGLPKILPFLKPYKAKMLRMMTFALLVSMIDALYPLFNRYFLDHFVAEGTLKGLPRSDRPVFRRSGDPVGHELYEPSRFGKHGSDGQPRPSQCRL